MGKRKRRVKRKLAKVSGVGLERKRRKSNVFGDFKERRERLVEGGPKVRGGC